MKVVYSVAIEVGTESADYGAVVPDLEGCFSSGESFENALSNVTEAIHAHLELMALDGHLPPPRKSIDNHRLDSDLEGFVWSMVEIDIAPYLGKGSKINVTLPNLLTKRIDDYVDSHEGFSNRSQFLQVAAFRQLDIN
jgi:predicted RNase H-like HicB family nuclease